MKILNFYKLRLKAQEWKRERSRRRKVQVNGYQIEL